MNIVNQYFCVLNISRYASFAVEFEFHNEFTDVVNISTCIIDVLY